MNEAFSDMAGKAAERFADGRYGVEWSVGGDITRETQPLRWMDDPSKLGMAFVSLTCSP